MDKILDLTDINTKRFFIVGELNGNYQALMRLLYQQQFKFSDTLIMTGNCFDMESRQNPDMLIFLHNAMSAYVVKGKNEVKLIEDLHNPDRDGELDKSLGKLAGDPNIIKFIEDLPSVIKIGDYYVVHAGLDPTKPLEDQDDDVFYSIGEYDEDSAYYQDVRDAESWYEFPYLVNGKHVNVCFSKLYTEEVKVPAGYNLGRNKELNTLFRCLIIDNVSETKTVDIVTWQ